MTKATKLMEHSFSRSAMPRHVTEGYHLVHWGDSHFNYWAVSNVNINDLQSFKQLFEQQTARH